MPALLTQHVDAAEALERRRDELAAVVLVGDVAADGVDRGLDAGELLEAARAGARSATTWAPASASTVANRAPSPLEAPVTIATRPRAVGTASSVTVMK